MSSLPRTYCTEEQYLAFEREAEERHEYWQGVILLREGANRAHNLINVNLSAELSRALRHTPYDVHAIQLRLRVTDAGMYAYPDVMVVGDPPDLLRDGDADILLNPTIIIEVLSPSTEKYDRGEKFAHYRRLRSLQTYVLVSQDKARIELYERQADDRWLLSEYNGLEGTIYFATIDVTLNLAEIYERVAFEQGESEVIQ